MLFYLHFASTCFMCGLIWQIQINHYPLLGRVSPQRFQAEQQEHMRTIVFLVGPMMPAELLSGLWLLQTRPSALMALAMACLGLIWLSTALLQAPLHQKLVSGGFNAKLLQALVRTNWIRTVLWTARVVLLIRLGSS